MGIVETFMISVVIGIVVATAMWTAHCHTLSVLAVFDLIVWAILWPFFAPLLFGHAVPVASPPKGAEQRLGVKDSRLHETQQRLVQAIGRLDSLAEEVIKPQLTQIDAMVHSLELTTEDGSGPCCLELGVVLSSCGAKALGPNEIADRLGVSL